MQYIYNQKSLPLIDVIRIQGIHQAAERLVKKIEAANVDQLALSDYGKENVRDFQSMTKEAVKKYVHIVAWAMFPDSRAETFVDYGGGHGFLACLAREVGFARVVYTDIFEQCCQDARLLAQHLDCTADEYVCGDIHYVQQSLSAKRPASCALASINVIEHIYDMTEFIHVASSLSAGSMTLVLSTSANPLNPIVRRRHYSQHRKWEFTDGPHEGSYPMDTLKAFLSVRKDIIKQFAPELADFSVEALATATRGLKKSDIENCVQHFKTTGVISVRPNHPTNTCDPLTGSWQERLLNISDVTRELESRKFEVSVMGGYYSGRSSDSIVGTAKKAAANVLNHAISFLGTNGARLAPCFMFHAIRR